MRDLKKKLKIAGFMFLVASIIAGFVLFAYIQKEMDKYYIIINALNLTISAISCIIYFVLSSKSDEEIIKRRSLCTLLMYLNIMSGIIQWIVSVYVAVMVASAYQKDVFKDRINPYMQGGIGIYNPNNFSSNDIDPNSTDYQVMNKVDYITREIKKLDELKRQNFIDEDEYNKLKKEVVDEVLNNKSDF